MFRGLTQQDAHEFLNYSAWRLAPFSILLTVVYMCRCLGLTFGRFGSDQRGE